MMAALTQEVAIEVDIGMTGCFSFPGFLKMMRRWAGVSQGPQEV